MSSVRVHNRVWLGLGVTSTMRQADRMTTPWATGRFTTAAELVDHTHERPDLARLVQAMRSDLVVHPGEWENGTLERFLDALAALLEQPERTPEGPTWHQLAQLLVTATGYE